MERLRKVNSFVGERLQIACDTIIDITQAVTESFQPLEKHVPDLIPRFVEGQKALFNKRKNARDRLLSREVKQKWTQNKSR
jgi:hypothetical protein